MQSQPAIVSTAQEDDVKAKKQKKKKRKVKEILVSECGASSENHQILK
jgi:hypothetical protein